MTSEEAKAKRQAERQAERITLQTQANQTRIELLALMRSIIRAGAPIPDPDIAAVSTAYDACNRTHERMCLLAAPVVDDPELT